ncbi:MAG: M48 family metalloprotease [Ferruginibacter sp.]
MKTRFPLIVFLFFIFLLQVQAQNYATYTGYTDDRKFLSGIQHKIQQEFVKDSLGVTGENKKYIQKKYRERRDFLMKMFEDSLIVSAESSNKYLALIVNEIVNKNPELQTLDYRPLFYRAWWPNASATGEGTLLFNTGLFYRMENESQVAFVLCHELAHQYLDHVEKSIKNYVNTVYDDEFQKELKKIKKLSYEKNKRLDELEKTITFSNRRHSREHEAEADAMALTFMSRTSFDTRQSLTALALLDTIDKIDLGMEDILRKHFTFPGFAFKDNWIKKESTFFGGAETVSIQDKKDIDSLKTHPDCKLRIKLLEPEVAKTTGNRTLYPINENTFKDQQAAFRYEIIETLYKKEYISRALFQSLELLQTQPGVPYLVSIVGGCLNKLYTHQKNHTRGTITDKPSPFIEKDYNVLLKFLEALRLDEIATLANHFLTVYSEPGKNNLRFEKELIESRDHIK